MTDALIIIDMQQGSFGPTTPRHDAAGLVGRLNRLAGEVRATGGAVVFIQHDGPSGDPHHPDLPGWQLLADLDARPGDGFVRKMSCDAFLGTSLEAFLARHEATRLIVTGCATD
jgi:nicotinamidase-related amidase